MTSGARHTGPLRSSLRSRLSMGLGVHETEAQHFTTTLEGTEHAWTDAQCLWQCHIPLLVCG